MGLLKNPITILTSNVSTYFYAIMKNKKLVLKSRNCIIRNSKLPVILFFISVTLLTGCTPSLIKYMIHKDNGPYLMFGNIPSRDFYTPVSLGDSLSLLWQSETNGSFPNSSVTVYDSLVFVNDLSGRIFAFKIISGKEVGELKYKGAVYSSPVFEKYMLIFPVSSLDENNTHLIYYDIINGKTLEDKELHGRALTQILKTDKGVIFNTDNGIVYNYNFVGDKVWSYETNSYVHSSPALSENIVVFGNDNGEIIGIDAKKGSLIYRNKIAKSFFGGTTISGKTVYLGNDNGIMYAVNLLNGKLNWTFSSGAGIIMNPACDKENVIFGNLAGDLFSLNKNDGKLNWKLKTGGLFNATPLLANNLVFAPDLNERLFLVNINDGNIVKEIHFSGRLKLSPVYHMNRLFIGFDNGKLNAYKLF
jgi:outer membrane protein assembly factor BamB